MDILSKLNKEQRLAVEHTDGPTMVIAGAGSGKTRVLTYKIAHLINKGVTPHNILSLTFTNKAAREMKERVEQLIGGTEARYVWMGTFHSIFARILRAEAEHIGYNSQFTIYDTDDSKSLLKKIVKNLNLDEKDYKISTVLARISSAKSNLISHIDYNNNAELKQADLNARKPRIGDIYTSYQERLRRSSAMDFDDLLFNTNVLLRDHPKVLLKYQRRFKYILVDEFQDTNFAQYVILKKLAANNENICVVGDDAQSIYAFRGANIQNILNLKKSYPELSTYKLTQNYRSTKNIINTANSIIEKNQKQIKKKIWTSNDTGDKVELHSTSTDNEEGSFVARKIFELIKNEEFSHKDFAILYRTNAQSRAIEEALRKMNMPYKLFGGLSFYKRKEIKDILAYFRLAINYNDEEALSRIINYPRRGIGKTTMEKIQVAANENKVSIWDVVSNIYKYNILNSSAAKKIDEFSTMIKSFAIKIQKDDAYEAAIHIAKSSGVFKQLSSERDDEEGIIRFENVEELLNGIKDFSEQEVDEEEKDFYRLNDFMEDIALHTDADDSDKQDGDFVSLMTIHASKGLEFPVVFIVGLEENLFPSLMSVSSPSDMEEERRLFYVAITRGEKRVFISYSELRYKWGQQSFSEPSRFIHELDENYVEDKSYENILSSGEGFKEPKKEEAPKSFGFNKRPKYPPKKKETKKPAAPPSGNFKRMSSAKRSSSSAAKVDNSKIISGAKVYHERFGKGKVLKIEGANDNKKAVVFFNNAGEKKLLLKFAKLKILE